MMFPEAADAPLTFVADTIVQAKVVPVTAFGLVIAIAGDVPEQIVASEAAASGIGFTVTT